MNEIVPSSGALVRQLDGSELSVASEVNPLAMAAREEALIKARCALALKQPRDIATVRVNMIAQCKRPVFAETALYSVPFGETRAEGLTIRAAEAFARDFKNLLIVTTVISDDADKRCVEVTVMDLESNFTETQQAMFAKTLERKYAPKGAEVLGTRITSKGDKIFIVRATDAEVLAKQNSIASRIRRNKILEMIPADLRTEAIAQVRATLAAETKRDPQAALNKLFDSFAEIGVSPESLDSYAQSKWKIPMARIASVDPKIGKPEHMEELRKLYNSVREGRVSWEECMAEVAGDKSVSKSGEVVSRPPSDVQNEAKAPAPEQAEPQPALGTNEHADWLLRQLERVKSHAEKMQLAKQISVVPKERKAEIEAAFLRKVV